MADILDALKTVVEITVAAALHAGTIMKKGKKTNQY